MRRMYVFNPSESTGYLFSGPEFVARAFCAAWTKFFPNHTFYDYAPSPEGY